MIGGKFLERTRIAKPDSSPEKPVYYGPQDFYIGAIVIVFKHRFKIVNADKYVLDFAENHADQFPGACVKMHQKGVKLHKTCVN